MASLRQKESKIPLRVDLKPKNGSKIPLRMNQKPTLTKPKVIPSAEPALKRASVIVRSKKPTTEVKRVKKSNLSSQVLKDRNKITTKEVPQKSKPSQRKQKENPLCSFEKSIPKINLLDDDPFKTVTEEKQIENSNHPSQQNIEFVADERMKKLILSNRELTPSILKPFSKVKISSVMERPSLYKKLNSCRSLAPVDPYKQALTDIATLASEGRRCSEMQRNVLDLSPGLMERPSLYKKLNSCRSLAPVDPYKQALTDIATLASEGRRCSEMQRNSLYLSPGLNRNSLYNRLKSEQRGSVQDPYKEALKSIAELRVQQKIKSCKKVTFNLSGDKQSNSEAKDANHGKNPVSAIQPEMSEKVSGRSTPPSPKVERNMLLTPGNTLPKKVTFDTSSKTDEVLENGQINNRTDLNQLENKTDFFNNKTSASDPSLTTAASNKVFNDLSPILQKQKIDKYAAIFNHDIKKSILKMTVNPFLNSANTSEVRQSLFSNHSERFLDKMNPKIYTPQPVSFYPQTKLSESISPEFLSRKTADILSCIPINTPLVLKSLSRLELSPVCKKLEFQDSPKKESKKEDGDSRENSQTFNLQNIMTQQKILDQLAHQECSIFMHEAEFPCEVRENLQNPIARILNDGDEMHFVPLRRLS